MKRGKIRLDLSDPNSNLIDYPIKTHPSRKYLIIIKRQIFSPHFTASINNKGKGIETRGAIAMGPYPTLSPIIRPRWRNTARPVGPTTYSLDLWRRKNPGPSGPHIKPPPSYYSMSPQLGLTLLSTLHLNRPINNRTPHLLQVHFTFSQYQEKKHISVFSRYGLLIFRVLRKWGKIFSRARKSTKKRRPSLIFFFFLTYSSQRLEE